MITDLPEHSQNSRQLLTNADVLHAADDLPPWAPEAFESLCATLAPRTPIFPCFYARRALYSDALRYVFVDTTRPDAIDDLAAALALYATSAQDIGPFTALLAIFPPDDPVLSLQRYRERFWLVLRELHARDPATWPASIPTNPSNQLWEFCFNGEAMFVLCSNPGHQSRRTRYSDNFVISFQPRFMFDRLIAQRHLLDRAREQIRSRVLAFDGFAVHPQIGMYFESTNLEWRQYFVPDDNALITEECPFHSA